MIITVYRSHVSLLRSDESYGIHWAEYAFAPLPREDGAGSRASWRRWRSAAEPIAISSRVGTAGLSAESIYWLACRNEKGFSLIGGESLARKHANGPTLFAAEEPNGIGPYRPALRMVAESPGDQTTDPVAERVRLQEIAAQVVREHQTGLTRLLDQYQTAIQRAIEQLRADRPESARAILEVALEATS